MELFTLPEAARKIRMSVPWLRQKIFSKEIRYLKIGSRIFIPEETIQDILTRSVVEPRGRKKE